jgi:predicted nucleotidyltransferase
MQKIRKDDLTNLKKHFQNKAEITAVYLFGSTIKGYERPESDLDIAVLLEPSFKHPGYDYQLKLEEELNNILDTEVDVIIINDVPLPLQYSSAVQGKLIYSKDDLKRAQEEIKIMDRYEDLKDFYQLRYKANIATAKKDFQND